MNTKKYILGLVLVDIVVMAIAFSWVGFYSIRTDTDHYVNQIRVLRGEITPSDLSGPFREMYFYKIYKPFYSILSVFPFGFLSPLNVILFINILFLIGITVISFYFFKILDFDSDYAFIGSLWLAASYPVFKYGLALVTDISGWFFALVTIFLFLYSIKNNKLNYLLLVSILGFLGSISKETGVLGLLFCGLYLVLSYREIGLKETTKRLVYTALPFLILQTVLVLIMVKLHASSLFAWIKFNYDIFFKDFYKLKYFITNEFLSFGLVWLFCLFGFYYFFKDGVWMDKQRRQFSIASVLATLPVLLWPVFYYRILFIQFLFVIPISLYGFKKFSEWLGSSQYYLKYVAVLVPPVFNIILFLLIQKY